MAINIASPWREQFLTSLFSVRHWVAFDVGATSVPSNEKTLLGTWHVVFLHRRLTVFSRNRAVYERGRLHTLHSPVDTHFTISYRPL
jgi:hypothetical protein